MIVSSPLLGATTKVLARVWAVGETTAASPRMMSFAFWPLTRVLPPPWAKPSRSWPSPYMVLVTAGSGFPLALAPIRVLPPPWAWSSSVTASP